MASKPSEKFVSGGPAEGEASTTRRRTNRIMSMWRDMKGYCISENEIHQLSSFNDLSTLFFSAATFTLYTFIDAIIFLSKEEQQIRQFVMWASGILTIGFIVGGFWMLSKRSHTIKVIREESGCEKDK